MKLKVKDIGNSSDTCAYLFQKRGFELTQELDEADIVVFNGGSDIGTEIYGQKLVLSRIFNDSGDLLTSSDPSFMSARDKMEIIAYKRARSLGKFILGVCRGAQLINCLEGGSLWQHVNNHNNSHPIIDLRTNQIYRATSVHHQMLRVPENGEIIAVACESSFKIDANEQKRIKCYGTNLEDGDDPEVVWFRDARALCVQGHPEYSPDSLYADYCFELIKSLYYDGVWANQAPASSASV